MQQTRLGIIPPPKPNFEIIGKFDLADLNASFRALEENGLLIFEHEGIYHEITCFRLSLQNKYFSSRRDFSNFIDALTWLNEANLVESPVKNIGMSLPMDPSSLKPGTTVFVEDSKHKPMGEGKIVDFAYYNDAGNDATFKIKLYNNEEIEVGFNSNRIYLFGKDTFTPHNELDEIKHPLNAKQLNVFSRQSPDGFEVYWQELKEAAGYSVAVYTWFKASIDRKLYKMKEFTIERGQMYFSIRGLSQGRYYVVVSADDRSGKRVACSNAISIML